MALKFGQPKRKSKSHIFLEFSVYFPLMLSTFINSSSTWCWKSSHIIGDAGGHQHLVHMYFFFSVHSISIDVAGGVKGLHSSLAGRGGRLVLSFGGQAVDLMGADERRKGQSQMVALMISQVACVAWVQDWTDKKLQEINHLQNCVKLSNSR